LILDGLDYTQDPDIEASLLPWKAELEWILNLDSRNSELPVMKWLKSAARDKARKLQYRTPYWSRNVSNEDFARISRWCQIQFDGFFEWRVSLIEACFAHAKTLLIAYRYQGEFKQLSNYPASGTAEAIHAFLLEQAFERLQSEDIGHDRDHPIIDVEKGVIQSLEENMFEQSTAAGRAGNKQWGKTEGNQDNWDPYLHVPMSFDKRKPRVSDL
jgi:hypothetical protein